jgi:hypothetical protein
VRTAKSTRLLFTLALLAAVVPLLLADRANADEIALKCSFSLWTERTKVGPGTAQAHARRHGVWERIETPQAFEARLAHAPSQMFETTHVIDLAAAGTYEITRESIRIWPDGSINLQQAVEVFPGRGHAAGFFSWTGVKINRIELGAEALLRVFFGRNGRSADASTETHFADNWRNIWAEVTVKGSCTRVPKML